MRITIGVIALLLAACAATSPTQRVNLCDALGKVQPGEQMNVVVAGVVVSGSEITVLFDPNEPVCSENIQPATSVEFAPGVNIAELNQALSRNGEARVIVSGVLSGPRRIVDDGVGAPELMARAVATNRRYGHLNMFRTQLVIDQVLSAEPFESTVEAHWNVVPKGRAPMVSSASVPAYPNLARAAGIAGDVHLRFKLVDGTPHDIEVKSGDRLLAHYAIENIKTWRFAEKHEGNLETTFAYRLERRKANENLNARVEMLLPERVMIVGAADDW